MPLDQLDCLARIEAPLHHERATMGKRRAHRIGRAEGPEQWRGHEYTIAGLQSLALADVEAVLDRRAVTQRNGLRVGARPRGIKDECNVVRPRAISRGQRLERLMRFEEIGIGHRTVKATLADKNDELQVRIRRRLPSAVRTRSRFRHQRCDVRGVRLLAKTLEGEQRLVPARIPVCPRDF